MDSEFLQSVLANVVLAPFLFLIWKAYEKLSNKTADALVQVGREIAVLREMLREYLEGVHHDS